MYTRSRNKQFGLDTCFVKITYPLVVRGWWQRRPVKCRIPWGWRWCISSRRLTLPGSRWSRTCQSNKTMRSHGLNNGTRRQGVLSLVSQWPCQRRKFFNTLSCFHRLSSFISSFSKPMWPWTCKRTLCDIKVTVHVHFEEDITVILIHCSNH